MSRSSDIGSTAFEPRRASQSAASAAVLSGEAELFVKRALSMMGRARLLVEADREDATIALNQARARLGQHFLRYQAFKHSQIFDPIVTFGPASSKVVARSMKVDCMQLGETFGSYRDRWFRFRPNEWPSYRRDMLETTDLLKVHLEAELRAMQQLLMISKLYRD